MMCMSPAIGEGVGDSWRLADTNEEASDESRTRPHQGTAHTPRARPEELCETRHLRQRDNPTNLGENKHAAAVICDSSPGWHPQPLKYFPHHSA